MGNCPDCGGMGFQDANYMFLCPHCNGSGDVGRIYDNADVSENTDAYKNYDAHENKDVNETKSHQPSWFDIWAEHIGIAIFALFWLTIAIFAFLIFRKVILILAILFVGLISYLWLEKKIAKTRR